MRERVYTLRLSALESERLAQLADHYGLSEAAVIRMLVKRDADSLAAKPKRRAARGRQKA